LYQIPDESGIKAGSSHSDGIRFFLPCSKIVALASRTMFKLVILATCLAIAKAGLLGAPLAAAPLAYAAPVAPLTYAAPGPIIKATPLAYAAPAPILKATPLAYAAPAPILKAAPLAYAAPAPILKAAPLTYTAGHIIV
jgi:hypothetical protein